MSTEPAGGAIQSEAQQVDAAAIAAAAAAAAEAGAGAGAADEDDARITAEREREAYIARVAGEAATRAVEAAISRLQPAPSAPAATPPTASRGVVAELEAEGHAIEQERARLAAAFARDGYTGENIVSRSELSDRTARFVGQVNLYAVQMSEQNRAVESRGTEAEWKKLVQEHPGTDITILREVFDARQAKSAKPADKSRQEPESAGARVNLSAPSEVTAAQAKARTMTYEQTRIHRESLREQGKDDDVAAFDRRLRAREIIVKG